MKYIGLMLVFFCGLQMFGSVAATGNVFAAPRLQQETPHDSLSRRYSIKSAIITLEVETDGKKSFSALCFDDYGQKEALESKSFLKAGNNFDQIHTLEILNGDDVYFLDLENRTGIVRKKNKIRLSDKPDFSSLTPETMRALGLMKNSPVEYLGKMCDSYVMHNERLNIHGKYLVWHNIVVWSEINAAGVISKTAANRIMENAPVPPKNFEVPLDIIPEERPE